MVREGLQMLEQHGPSVSQRRPCNLSATEGDDDNAIRHKVDMMTKIKGNRLKEIDTDDTIPKRETWNNHCEFILSMVGSCVGLGNVWRFPYLCYKNGGGAFLVPYVVTVACSGVPMFLLEVSLGQFYSRGAMNVWGASPPFKGIGIGGTVMCFIVNIYYIIVISWIAYYLWHSFTPNLPWKSCENAWNRDTCVEVSKLPNVLCSNDRYNYNISNAAHHASLQRPMHLRATATQHFPTSANESSPPNWDASSFASYLTNIVQDVPFEPQDTDSGQSYKQPLETYPSMNLSSVFQYSQMAKNSTFYCFINNKWVNKDNITEPVREFWERQVLKISSGLDDVGSLNIDMAVTLLVCWIICYFCIFKGIRWTGKVVYFTALMPYLLLLVLLVYSLQLPGAATGLSVAQKHSLGKEENFPASGYFRMVWLAAVSQVFYSYALAFGSVVTFGSYNKFNTNCYRDSLFISVVNSCTSLLAGVIVFSIVGFMSHTQHKPVEEVALSGPGLAFLVFPAAASEMPLSSLWSIIFFFTLLMIGLDSEFCFVESFITSMTDQFPRQLRPRKELFTACVCLVSCLLGLVCVTESGIYVFQLLDNYACGGMCLVWFVFWSSIAIGWGYGADRWVLSIQAMIGYHPGRWWPFCWKYVVPVLTAVVFTINLAKWKPLTYVNYEYTTLGNAIGWLMAMTSMIWVPAYFIYYIITVKKQATLKLTLVHIFRPDAVKDVNQQNPPTAV